MTDSTDNTAKKLCFEDCSKGRHLDFEAGCCSVCKKWEDCQGFMAYRTPALAAFDKDATP